jgi:hypothetical protein
VTLLNKTAPVSSKKEEKKEQDPIKAIINTPIAIKCVYYQTYLQNYKGNDGAFFDNTTPGVEE